MSSSLTDADLLKRYLREGAQDAFATLVERHLALVYGVALRRLHDPTPAQEVTQNVFITLARQAVWLTGHSSLGGWLYRTTLNLVQHEWRAEQRRRKREEIALELGTCMKTDESLFSTIAPLLDEAMLELRTADREALLLRFFANKSLREVGAALGIREDAAQKRVSKALDALAKRFRQRGFRVAGAAALAWALQQSSAHAVPAGLALSATQTAISAGATASLGAMTIPIVKFMSLTKIQTALLCVSIAALPLGYQLHTLTQARHNTEELNSKLAALRIDLVASERSSARAAARVAAMQRRLLQAAKTISHSAASQERTSAYLWDERSPYVCVPKQIMSRVRFAPFVTRVGRDGKTERYQLPPLQVDGTPQPALEAALGLSAEEAGPMRDLCQSEFEQFQQLVSAHSQLSQGTWGGGSTPTVTLATTAFADEGAQVRDQFQQQFSSLLGPERAAAYWEQASPILSDLFDEFGSNQRQLQLIDNPNGLELMTAYRSGTTPGPYTSAAIGALSQLHGMPLPPELQAYATAWTSPANAQPGDSAQQQGP
jgi:RNA polymerase sigma factor (sigma-70 family)